MPRPVLLALLALALLPPAASNDAPAPYAPLSVTAEALDPTAALVEWTPGLEAADSYRVYGVNAEGVTLLVDTSDLPAPASLAVIVPAGFSTYAVSGIKGSQESALIYALNGAGAGCIYVEFHPPGIGREDCKVSPRVKVFLPL